MTRKSHKTVSSVIQPAPTVVPLRPAREGVTISPRMRVQVVEPAHIDRALSLILAEEAVSQRQVQERVRNFVRMADQNGYDLTRQMVGHYRGKMVTACLFVPGAGRTAFLVVSGAGKRARQSPELDDLAVETMRQASRWAFDAGSNLLEVLLEPTDRQRQKICTRSGFRQMAELLYLAGLSEPGRTAAPLADRMNWLHYEPARCEQFKSVIAQTYQGSLDCPELENLREMEDVIAGHQAAGQFDPRLWKLLLCDGKPIGVLLLAPVSSTGTMELTYMGLCPPVRGKRLGELLVREALSCASQWGFGSLMLAVDSRNLPARRLYERLGLKVIMRRAVLLYSDRWQ